MNLPDVVNFRTEIQRQISNGSTYTGHVPGVVTVGDLGESYLSSLRRLDWTLADGLDPSLSFTKANLDASLLWNIPRFTSPRCSHLDASCIIQRRMFRYKNNSSFPNNYTEDIWKHHLLSGWLQTQVPTILLLQPDFDSLFRVGRFGVELAQHIQRRQGVVYLPINMIHQHGEFDTCNLVLMEMLRLVVIQVLHHAELPDSIQVLIEITNAASTAATLNDWLQLFGRLTASISELSIILDFATHRDAGGLSREFSIICDTLNKESPKTLIRFMLIGYHLPPKLPRVSVLTVRRPDMNSYHLSIRGGRRNPIPEHMNSLPEKNLAGTPGVALQGSRDTTQSQIEPSSAAVSDRELSTPAESNIGTVSKPKSRHEFHIAIFCALVIESDAVLSLMDQHWNRRDYGKVANDPNSYSLGTLGIHNVVIIHLPGMGKGVAASAASSCRVSFPGIKLALVVGICGGVPFGSGNVERILGDVIISDGLVQYDFGRQFSHQFKRKRTLHDSHGRPASEIRGFLARFGGRESLLKALRVARGYLISLRAAERIPTEVIYRYPGVEEDVLHQPRSLHKHSEASKCPDWENTCGSVGVCELAQSLDCQQLDCDTNQLVARQRLQAFAENASRDSSEMLELHIGTIASGDKVMKSGAERDRVANEEGIIAFEMEGAGVWDHFPCLVIKGICDYADCHKSKKWQHYAAATAASCMKAVLDDWD